MKKIFINIDEIIEWLGENGYDYNISKEGETYGSFNTNEPVESTTYIGEDVEIIWESINKKSNPNKKSNRKLLKESVEEAIKLGRKYMRRYDYDSEDKPTQQEWDLALTIFNHRINGGFN